MSRLRRHRDLPGTDPLRRAGSPHLACLQCLKGRVRATFDTSIHHRYGLRRRKQGRHPRLAEELHLLCPYSQRAEPLRIEENGSNAVPDAPIRSVTYVWIHPMAEIIGSLLRAGLRITAFEEYPFVAWTVFPWLERGPERYWQLPNGGKSMPLMFSLKATKDTPRCPSRRPQKADLGLPSVP